MIEPEGKHRNSIIRQRILAVFGLVEIVLRYTLTMNDCQGLMMELEDPGNQYGQSVFQNNSNNRKHRSDTLFYYRVLMPTSQLHHKTLKFTRGESTSQDNSNKLKHN
ncbi:hypothetical protein EVAR_82354_1 [Eumeta japonica]|uniref:Uncharacterized protein n=1 Tax=Eumeta variegata TaxID=151549 RepID=A0A4C1UAS1_EUMVA|nr:hypothetical protein EVAR_82354_1 [Eumeta japonica]